MSGGPASLMGNRSVKRSGTRKVHFWDSVNIHGTSMCRYLQTENFVGKDVTEKIIKI